MSKSLINKTAELLRDSGYTTAFTGAGISVESGIPPFRGENGLWNKYDPKTLELSYFHSYPLESWTVIKEIFYDFFGSAKPNPAHLALAELEKNNLLKCIITQNIDNLHQEAGSSVVYEFHGNSKKLICTGCNLKYDAGEISIEQLPVNCPSCSKLLKPDFIFFGEGIPEDAYIQSVMASEKSEVMLVIGTTAEVMPAGQMPLIAKSNGATIIEINPSRSNLTDSVTDIFIQGKASVILNRILDTIAIK